MQECAVLGFIPVGGELGRIQFDHAQDVPTLVVGDLFLPGQLYRFHSVGEGAGQPGLSENGGGRGEGARGRDRLRTGEVGRGMKCMM